MMSIAAESGQMSEAWQSRRRVFMLCRRVRFQGLLGASLVRLGLEIVGCYRAFRVGWGFRGFNRGAVTTGF